MGESSNTLASAHKAGRVQATLFAALGDETRLRLVIRLSWGEPMSIKELARGTEMTRQAVTKHLHVLAGAGLARGKRTGREQLWSLDQRRLDEARLFLDRLSRQWDERLGTLKAMLEGAAD